VITAVPYHSLKPINIKFSYISLSGRDTLKDIFPDRFQKNNP
jgi:hypothetical protein